MKKLVRFSLILLAVAVVLPGCNCYKRMSKKADRIQYECNPSVLTLKGSDVTTEIKVTFPPKYFDEAAVLRITPVLVFDGGEIAGTPKYVQGELVADNYTVIPWKTGGTYTQTITFPYDSRADVSKLQLRIDSKCANKCKKKAQEYVPFATAAVANGISTLQNDANPLQYMSVMPDAFKRMQASTQNAEILYLINKSDVRKGELTTDQIKMFEQFVKENAAAANASMSSVYSKGYASPDGPTGFNDQLSKKRSESGQVAISKNLEGTQNLKYDIAAYGEDWDGFKAMVEQSDMQDKQLVLQVLQMYDNPAKREAELKNMSSVFKELANDILPKLRRTQFSATADTKGKSDAELKAAVASNVKSLNLEEMLFAATLYNDLPTKEKIYQAAADTYKDVRAYNNLGVVLAQEGKVAAAQAALEQAAKIKSAPEISNNLGAVALAQGKVEEAKKYLSSLNTADAKSNLALLALEQGDYAKAAAGLTGYDLAVAQVLNGNYAAAKTAIANDSSADADYLRAVIAMRQGDSAGAIASLKTSISKDSAKRAKAKKDVEFIKLFGTPEFQAL